MKLKTAADLLNLRVDRKWHWEVKNGSFEMRFKAYQTIFATDFLTTLNLEYKKQ